jgi:hypothetical protein
MAKRTCLQKRYTRTLQIESALQMPRIRTIIDKRAVDATYTWCASGSLLQCIGHNIIAQGDTKLSMPSG